MSASSLTLPGMAVSKPPSHLSTGVLVARARGGDAAARNELFGRYLAVLVRFAHGRVPYGARGLNDTDDVVQEALARALRRLEKFEPRHQGAFLAYLKTIVNNMLKDLARKAARTPRHEELTPDLGGIDPDPLGALVTREDFEIYTTALERLRPEHRSAVAHRMEQGWSYQQIAELLGCPTANAARMVVHRAMDRLTEEMAVLRKDPR
jgi:RNA polymerase sigma-70 factor (ECF subfamily)